ncbi:Mbeg1-like protein [Ensifer adhaerens]|uniref:DUF2974 domain-containing protein n=1 Tax=Ensifer adhaerens TaxID=106592 RepID=A0A9Q8YG46_ENSAD|nr:Mbeg1-like protein [Ensifer adhaerens]USJ27576.1 DUF2974 domain-containing protein [Ensifer adhaerens]
MIVWSGANSISARDAAARSLAAELDNLQTMSPQADIVVVGHSHGGNIAIQSLSYLAPTTEAPLIVSIATPFFRVFERKRRAFSFVMAAVAGLIMLQSMIGPVLKAIESLSLRWVGESSLYYAIIALLFLLSVSALQLTMYIMGLFGLLPGNKSRRYLARLRAQSAARVFTLKSPPTLILRGIDDEATLTLSFGLAMIRTSRLFFPVITPFFLLVHVAPFLLEGLFNIPRMSPRIDERASVMGCFQRSEFADGIASPLLRKAAEDYEVIKCANAVLDFVSYYSPMGLFLAMLLISASLATFGTELFFCGLFCEINLSSAPDGCGVFEMRTLGESAKQRRFLRHKLYDNPQCAPTLAKWISTTLSASS